MNRAIAPRLIALLLLVVFASSCETMQNNPKALLGGAIGNHLDQKDKELAARNAQLSLESARTGQASSWRNPDNGNSGTLTPTRTYQSAGGQYCREYQQQITVGGEKQQSYGTACRQPDGSWKIQS